MNEKYYKEIEEIDKKIEKNNNILLILGIIDISLVIICLFLGVYN